MFKEDLFAHLNADNGIKAIATGVFSQIAPESQPSPYIVFSKVTTQRGTTYCASDNMQRALYQFGSYAKTALQASQLAKALRGSLLDFKGPMGSTHVGSILLDNEIEVFDSEPGLFGVLTTLFIWHQTEE